MSSYTGSSNFSKDTTLAFVGAGAVGGSLAVAMSQRGYAVIAAASRTFASAQSFASRIPGCSAFEDIQKAVDAADFVFVTTSDDAIPLVASSVRWREGQGVAHCSGAATLDILNSAAEQGAVPGAFHPLQAFSSVENGVKSIPGITFGIDGNDEMREFLSEVALAIGGNPIFIKSGDKPLYHLSGVMMGGLLSGLGAVAAQLWESFGFTRADGVKALAPMMRQVSLNLETQGVPAAMAGPHTRGDIGTIRKHLDVLKVRNPDILPLYCELSLAVLPFNVEKGALSPQRAEEIRQLVELYKP